MVFQTLRLFHIYEVVQTLNRLLEKLADIFYLQSYLFKNLFTWGVTATKFLLFVHYFACGWIWMQKAKLTANLPHVSFSDDTTIAMYVDSIYLITTTITTVGYGDINAINSFDADWTDEMIYLYFVTLCGITIFSSVIHDIFSYKKLLTAREIINKRVSEIDCFMYEVSKLRKDNSLTDEMFEQCKNFIAETTSHSTRIYFQEND